MNDPNKNPPFQQYQHHHRQFQRSQRTSQSNNQPAAARSSDTTVDDSIIDIQGYQSFGRQTNQELQDDRNFIADQTDYLEPRPIRHMTVTNHVAVQELQSRDMFTAQMVRELFVTRSATDASNTMTTNTSYQRISSGYYDVEETKLDPSHFRNDYDATSPRSTDPPRRRIRRDKDMLLCDEGQMSLDQRVHPFQVELTTGGSERPGLNPVPAMPSVGVVESSDSAARRLYRSSAVMSTEANFGNKDDHDHKGAGRPIKRAHQSRALKPGQWLQRFQELVEYKGRFGSCHVPHNWEHNVPLAQWVKRQRYQYTLREDGKHSTLTDDRKRALDDIGFVWSSHTAVWLERLDELRLFKEEFGHCNVPKNFHANKALAVWIKSQRRQYKLFQRGKQGTMTEERVAKLNELGFVWDPRSTAFSEDKKPRAKSRSRGDDVLNYDSSSDSSGTSVR
ncbi:helicase domain protein [Nitzschia inconspicua]|uniref:Helicase domain protein n=1 Tax=Nitzschia inconspicua TaxID=303405 RepID=A0A9K3KV49_9STRA|nr:helicase domain protein [Nitzschia inconspicua]